MGPRVLALLLTCGGPACARDAVVDKAAFACRSWAAWHEYTLASLTPKGARMSRDCPVRFGRGQRVDVIDEDDGYGAATVKVRGAIWYLDSERLK